MPLDAVPRSGGAIRRLSSLAIVLGLLAAIACKGSDEAGRVPLGDINATGNTAAAGGAGGGGATLPPAVRAQLDSGNAAYRTHRRYDVALRHYRAAAEMAPNHPAPFYGIWMAARALGRSAVADSAMSRIRTLSPRGAAVIDSAPSDPHANPGAGRGKLPSGHP
jgi:hypothetical protein